MLRALRPLRLVQRNMELLSKQEVAQNVLEYYVYHKEKLQRSLESYSEAQGKGFICWRFIHERRQNAA